MTNPEDDWVDGLPPIDVEQFIKDHPNMRTNLEVAILERTFNSVLIIDDQIKTDPEQQAKSREPINSWFNAIFKKGT